MAPSTEIFLAALFGFAGIHAQVWKKQTYMVFEKFDNCPEYRNYTTVLRNAKITVVNNLMTVNYENHVLKDSRKNLETLWEIQRCSSREKLDTCMMFTKLRSSRFCNMLEQTGEAWTPFLTCMKPRMVCPLRKGVYRGENCTIDAEAFRFFPLQGAYWRFRSIVLENKAIRSCVDIFGYVRDR